MVPIERDGVVDGGASFEHALARIHAGARQTGVRVPIINEARHPVVGEALGVQPALGKAIIVAHIHRAEMPLPGRQEPNARLHVRPCLVIAEQRPVGVGQHKNGAGAHWHGGEGENRQDKCQSPPRNSCQEAEVRFHSCDPLMT